MENRRVKRIALAAGILTTCLVLMGQAKPTRIIQAEKFVLLGPSGKVEAELAANSAGNPFLRFFDKSGKARSVLTGRGYTIFGDKNYPPANIPVNKVSLGANGISFMDEDGNPEILLQLYELSKEMAEHAASRAIERSSTLTLYGPDRRRWRG